MDEQTSTTPNTKDFTDKANSERFVAAYSGEVKFDHRRNRWMVWREHWWAPDTVREVMEMAKTIASECVQVSSEGQRAASQKAMNAMLELAKSDPRIRCSGDEWDAQPFLLGVKNGVVDLRSGTLRPGNPDDLISKRVDINFNPDALSPRWQQYLREVFPDDEELIGYVRRVIGYALTGDTSEQAFFVLVGRGSNGKSVLLSVLAAIAGDYGWNMRFGVVDAKSRDRSRFDLASLEGARLVTSSEANADSKFDAARLKSLTGGDRVTAEVKYGSEFTFENRAKFFFAVNAMPSVDDDTDGTWRRLHRIPFERKFTGAEINPNLLEDLLAEKEGILAWAVSGAVEWSRSRLQLPDRLALDVLAEREANDPLAEFVRDCCITEQDARSTPTEMWLGYIAWAESVRVPHQDRLSMRRFQSTMRDRYNPPTRSATRRDYLGIRLKPGWPPVIPDVTEADVPQPT